VKYVISKYLIANVNGVIQSTATGQQYELTEEVLTLLAYFKKPISINEVLDIVCIKKSESPGMTKFIKNLIKEGLLVKESAIHNEQRVSLIKMTNQALLQTTRKTFFGCNNSDINQISRDDLVFIGMPFDLGTTGFPGTRFGPDKIRDLSFDAFEYHGDIFERRTKGWLSLEHNRDVLVEKKIVDVGNVMFQIGEEYEQIYSRLKKIIDKVISKKAFPIIIGGDHSCSYSAVKSLSNKYRNLGIIHIDAHTDLADIIPGISHNHGNVFSRILKEKLTKHLYQFGIRGMIGKKLERSYYSLFSQTFLENSGLEMAVGNVDSKLKYYISLDIDVLDPIFVPGTGTPVQLGMDVQSLLKLLSLIISRVSIVGFDLVEVNPMLDVNNQTAELANTLIVHILAELEKSSHSVQN